MAQSKHTGLFVVRSYTPGCVLVHVCKSNHVEYTLVIHESVLKEKLAEKFPDLPVITDLTKQGFHKVPSAFKS